MQALSSSAQSIETTKKTFAMISNSVRPLFDILQSNYGPCGTYKMLVSGGGEIKITKDGGTLLGEMQIRNPITSLIAKTVSMQETMAGDGTIALVLLISSLIMESEKFVMDGVHVSHIIEGITMGIEYCQKIIQEMAIPVSLDRPLLIDIAKCSVATKIPGELANLIAEQCVDAVHDIFDRQTMQLNLHMVEVMHMTHKTARDTQLVRGIVMDHGGRHPNMPRELKDCFILISNVSFEYEKTEVNADVGYSSAQAREAMFKGEREFIDKRCQQVVDLKNQVCKGNQGFVVLTMGGIDTHSLDIFAKHNILGLRRVKRRNLERLTLCCGGLVVNSTENLRPSNLGYAGHVKQISIGEENYTIVDQCKNPKSVTVLIKGPNQYTIDQMRDAIQDGLMSTANALVEQSALPGACSFELTASRRLIDYAKKVSSTNLKARIGVEILSRALESLPKSLAQNAGFDANSLILENQAISSDEDARKTYYGVNIATGGLFVAADRGIYDSVRAKMMMLHASNSIVRTFMSIDGVIKSAPSGMK
ncbi:MAG: Chaperonin containing TCP1 subunit 6B [Marteilia pararefringens]